MNNKTIWNDISIKTDKLDIVIWCRKNAEIPSKLSFVLIVNGKSIFHAWMTRTGKHSFHWDRTEMEFDYASLIFRACVEYAVKNMEMVVK